MLSLKNIDLALGDVVLIQDLSLDIAPGEIVMVMGPSGGGKSTLLSYIGGDVSDVFSAHGDVTLNDVRLNDVAPERRGIARLFQDDLLFPHMTVAENLMFAIPRGLWAERNTMMQSALDRAELSGFENRAPHTLSGGQRSRVALMRALLAKPAAILLDEPFSKLDKALRAQVRDYTFAHIKARGIPAIIVSHDLEDAPAGARVVELMGHGGGNGEVRHV